MPVSKPPKKIKSFLKLAISLGLLGAIYYTVDKHALANTLRSLTVSTALWLILLYTLGQLLSAAKWRILLESAGIHRTYLEIARSYFLGMFVNVFGFGTVGGDVTRALAINPEKGKRAAALSTAVADRIHGLAVLSSIAAVALLIERPKELGVFTNLLILGGFAGVFSLVLFWLLGPRILTHYFPDDHKFGEAAASVAHAFPTQIRQVLLATIISFVFHNLQILMHIIIARELGATLSLGYIYAVVPLANIVASLPISVMNGLGVREGMYTLLFVPAGVPTETAVAFGAIWLFSVTLVSSVGMLIVAPSLSPEDKPETDETFLDDLPEVTAENHEETSRRAVG